MSTIKVNSIKNASTDDGGIAIDNSGHVQVDGVQLPTAGPLSHRNLVVNGAMMVAQRGTSSTSSGYQTVDRFKNDAGGVSVTQSQQVLSSGNPYDEGFRYFLRLANTSTSTSNSSAAEIQYRVEAQDLAQSGWNYKSTSSYITFSFWVRSSLAGTYYVTYRARDASTLQYIKSFTLTANTWTKVTHTIPGGSNVVFNNDNGEGLRIMIVPHYGTTFTGSGAQLDAWHNRAGDDYFPDYAQSWSNTASATFDVTGVQLEVGEKATPFEHRSYGDELARCQRYYYECTSSTSNKNMNQQGVLLAASATAYEYMPIPPVPMRAAPSCTLTDDVAVMRLDGGTGLIEANLNGTDLLALPNGNGFSGHIFGSRKSGTGFSIGNAGRLCTGSTAGKLAFSAEL
jgi:hypothetical protein|tara:strand:- start:373 stop:1563 length:1191 start_codon:yes stop_codon:yes gene_type:complete